MSDRDIRDEWARAKAEQLEDGHASEWDRQTAALIRWRARTGVATTKAQRTFARKVAAIERAEKLRGRIA